MNIADALNELNNGILDLQRADHDTLAQPLKRLRRVLTTPPLEAFAKELSAAVDYQGWLQANDDVRRGRRAGMEWPDDPQAVLGLTICLIERAAADPDEFIQLALHGYRTGSSKIMAAVGKLTSAVIIPFGRDFANHVRRRPELSPAEDMPTDRRRIFIVHGHDEAALQSVARFIESLDLVAVILHEQANRGLTIPEKLAANSNVGFAVVLLTPDDQGKAKTEPDLSDRARQNVLLELGYFVGKLGRGRVCALLKGNLELPTDYVGTVYTEMDIAGAWRQRLAQELDAAGYEIDWNKVMRGR